MLATVREILPRSGQPAEIRKVSRYNSPTGVCKRPFPSPHKKTITLAVVVIQKNLHKLVIINYLTVDGANRKSDTSNDVSDLKRAATFYCQLVR